MAFGEVGGKRNWLLSALPFSTGQPRRFGMERCSLFFLSALPTHFNSIDSRTGLAHYAKAGIFVFFGLDVLLAGTTGHSIWGAVAGAASDLTPSIESAPWSAASERIRLPNPHRRAVAFVTPPFCLGPFSRNDIRPPSRACPTCRRAQQGCHAPPGSSILLHGLGKF